MSNWQSPLHFDNLIFTPALITKGNEFQLARAYEALNAYFYSHPDDPRVDRWMPIADDLFHDLYDVDMNGSKMVHDYDRYIDMIKFISADIDDDLGRLAYDIAAHNKNVKKMCVQDV